jgi:hypothetical protein
LFFGVLRRDFEAHQRNSPGDRTTFKRITHFAKEKRETKRKRRAVGSERIFLRKDI